MIGQKGEKERKNYEHLPLLTKRKRGRGKKGGKRKRSLSREKEEQAESESVLTAKKEPFPLAENEGGRKRGEKGKAWEKKSHQKEDRLG